MLDQSMEYGAAGEEPDLAEVDLAQVAEQLVLNSADLLDATGCHGRDRRPARRTR